MNQPIPQPPPPTPPSMRLIATLGLIAMFSGLAIVLVYQITFEPIARNRREALEKAVFDVLPNAVQRVNYRVDQDGLTRVEGNEVASANAYAGYTEDGRLVGLALPASARGYADVIRVLYGYDPVREIIIGFKVLQSAETPGLGDKIETDPAFLQNFEALSVKLNEEKSALLHDVVTVKRGQKNEPWQIDGITGATVSSMAIGQALRESTAELLPLLAPHVDVLREAPSSDGGTS